MATSVLDTWLYDISQLKTVLENNNYPDLFNKFKEMGLDTVREIFTRITDNPKLLKELGIESEIEREKLIGIISPEFQKWQLRYFIGLILFGTLIILFIPFSIMWFV